MVMIGMNEKGWREGWIDCGESNRLEVEIFMSLIKKIIFIFYAIVSSQ